MKHVLPQSLLFAAAAFASAGVSAQATSKPADFPLPNKPVRIVVPFTPGSATDIIARFVTPKLADRWGRSVVVDNRPSAGGIVACQTVAESTPDGHTLMVTGSNFAGSAAIAVLAGTGSWRRPATAWGAALAAVAATPAP